MDVLKHSAMIWQGAARHLPLLLCLAQGAAAGQTTFQRLYGGLQNEFATSIALANDGGYLIAGSTVSYGAGATDVYLIRVDTNGDTLWTGAYGGAGNEVARAVRAMPNGDWIVAGLTDGSGAGGYDALLFRVDAAGELLWSRTYGRSSSDAFRTAEPTNDGGLVMVGSSVIGSGTGMFAARTTADGDTLWTYGCKLIGPSLVSMNSYSVAENGAGEFLILGDANNLSVCYYFLAPDGVPITSGQLGLQNYVGGIDVISVSTGGYMVVGTTDGGAALDMFAMRLNEDLNPIWTKRYGGPQTEYGVSVKETTNGDFVIMGSTYSFAGAENDSADVYLVRIDTTGAVLWSRTYGSARHEVGEYVLQTPDGGFILAGTSLGFDGNRDVLLIKVDADGHAECLESTPPTATAAVNASRTSLNRTSSIGCSMGVPLIARGHGGDAGQPCGTAIGVPEGGASPPFIWLQREGELVLSGSCKQGAITIHDATGRVVVQLRAQDKETRIPLAAQAAGAYLVRYQDGVHSSVHRFVCP